MLLLRTIIIKPEAEGTSAENADTITDVKKLLDSGLPAAEVVLPVTKASNVDQLCLPFKE